MNSFQRTGKEISTEDAGLIVEKVKSHSWYVQQLSHFVWSATRKAVTVEMLISRRFHIVNTNLPFCMLPNVRALSSTQQSFDCYSEGSQFLQGATTMSKYKLRTPQNVSKK